MKEIAFTQQELNVILFALNVRLNSIRGYYLTEESHIESAINKIKDNIEE